MRLYALYNYGGVYLDSDVEVLKPIDKFLDDEAFSGFESRDSVPTAIMASVKGQRFMGELLHDYDDRKLILEDGSIDMTSNTVVITESCLKHGLKQNGKKQTIEGFTLYPAIYFCPNNISRVFNKPSRKSYTIHHSAGTWGDNCNFGGPFLWRVKRYLTGRLRNIIGTKNIKKLKRVLKSNG